MRDMEAGQSDHTVGLLTPVDASARGVDQPQHHDNLPEHAASRQSKPHQMDCFDYFCRRAELLVHGIQRCFASAVPSMCVISVPLCLQMTQCSRHAGCST